MIINVNNQFQIEVVVPVDTDLNDVLRDFCRERKFPNFSRPYAVFRVVGQLCEFLYITGVLIKAVTPFEDGHAHHYVRVTENLCLQTWKDDGVAKLAEEIFIAPREDKINALREVLKEQGWT